MRRRWRLVTVVLSLCALLFAQGALAAYACQGPAKAFEAARMAEAGMPCAESMSQAMDEEQPGLCHAHCQAAQGSLDHGQPVQIAAAADLGAVLTIVPAAQPAVRSAYVQASLLRPSAGPPLAISHCCFRI